MNKDSEVNDLLVKKLFNQRALNLKGNNAVLSSDSLESTIRQNIYRNFITQKSIIKYLRPKTNETILDFGCGIGRISKMVSKFSKMVIAIDCSDEMIKKAIEENSRPNIAYSTSENYLFKNNRFDAIYTCWVLQHISDNQLTKEIKKFQEILKKGGRIIILEQISKEGSIKEKVLHQRRVIDYEELFLKNDFKLVLQKPILRFPSYGMTIWMKYKLPNFVLPLLKLIENNTVNRNPENIDYVSTIMIFEK